MSFQQNPAVSEYQNIGRQTGMSDADAHGLIVLLYDGALEAIARARRHMESGEIPAKCESLTQAINIIADGLKASLDVKAGGAIAQNLVDLYDYMINRLVLANVSNRPEILVEVAELLRQLSDAWRQISKVPSKKVVPARSAEVAARPPGRGTVRAVTGVNNSAKALVKPADNSTAEGKAQNNASVVARYYGVSQA